MPLNRLPTQKALVVIGLSSDEWVNWDLVPGIVVALYLVAPALVNSVLLLLLLLLLLEGVMVVVL